MEFATRGQATNSEGPVEIGNIFYGTEGYLWIDADGRQWQSFLGRKAEKGPGADSAMAAGDGSDPRVLTSIEYPHYQNFIDAIRADNPKILTCDVLEGHISSDAPAPGQHLLPRRPGADLRWQDRDDRRRQGGERAPHADVPQGLRAAGRQRRRRHVEQQRVIPCTAPKPFPKALEFVLP